MYTYTYAAARVLPSSCFAVITKVFRSVLLSIFVNGVIVTVRKREMKIFLDDLSHFAEEIRNASSRATRGH